MLVKAYDNGMWQCECGAWNAKLLVMCRTCNLHREMVRIDQDTALSAIGVSLDDVPFKVPGNASKRKQPNKTEARYRDTYLRADDYRYEALTITMANGHRYTADWCGFAAFGQLHLIEIKGGYKLPSYQRSRLAFDQARIEFPQILFTWAVWSGGKWHVENYNGGAA